MINYLNRPREVVWGSKLAFLFNDIVAVKTIDF